MQSENARDEFPWIDQDDIPDELISEYVTQIAFHPNQRCAAATTGESGEGFQL